MLIAKAKSLKIKLNHKIKPLNYNYQDGSGKGNPENLLTIHPLDVQFNSFATTRDPERRNKTTKIELFAINAWFEQAGFFKARKVLANDIAVIYNRM